MTEDFIDYIFDNIIILIIIIISISIGVVWYVVDKENKERARLIAQCLADGKKEYECRAMLKDSTPTIIYMPSGR